MKITEHIANANGKTLFSFELDSAFKGAEHPGYLQRYRPADGV
jgi:hypothetical protein